MKNLIINTRFGLLCVALLLGFPTAAALAEDSQNEQMRAYLDRLQAETGSPGISAAVMVGGKLVYSGGVGIADLQAGTAQTGRSVHNIGSISKTMAVIGVMQLVERGLVKLDEPIQTYTPWFPRKDSPITVRQLLTHTSGIGHYDDIAAVGQLPPEARFRHFTEFEESTRFWRDAPLVFAPGSHWHYSSFATNLMQAIVETASGEPFEDYLRTYVWEPAGMLATQFDVPSRIIVGRGRGYVRNAETGQFENDPDEDVSYKYAGGGMLSTDEDLCRLGHALNSGVLLKPETLQEMYRLQLSAGLPRWMSESLRRRQQEDPAWVPPAAATFQALIWRVDRDASDRPVAHHSGSVKGTTSQLRNYPADDVVVALHFNYNDGGKDEEEAAVAIARLFLPPAAAGAGGPP